MSTKRTAMALSALLLLVVAIVAITPTTPERWHKLPTPRTATFTAASGTALASYSATGEPRFHKHPVYTTAVAKISTGGRVYCDSASGTVATVYFDDTVLSSPDYSVSLTVRCLSSVPGAGYLGVIGRADHKLEKYYLAIYNFASGQWELYLSGVGVFTSLGTFSQALVAGTDYVLKLDMTGSTIRILIDGVSRISVTDTTYTLAGRGGLAMFGQQTDLAGAHGDDFTVTGTLATYQVVCDGNSLTAPQGVTYANSYPGQLATLLGSTYAVVSRGVVSQTTQDMTADAADDIDALLSTSVTKNFLVAWEETNDLYFGATAAQAISHFDTYCSARSGFDKVFVISVLPRSGAATPGDFETSRGTVNTAMRSTYTGRIFDAAADNRIGDAGDERDVTYYQDETTFWVHLNATGLGIIAAGVEPLILAEVTDTTPPTVTLATTGLTLVMTPSEAITGVTAAMLTVAGHTITGVSGTGAGPYTFTQTPPFAQGETATADFAAANTVFDTAATPNAMATFTGKAISNTSTLTVPGAPTLSVDAVEAAESGIRVAPQAPASDGGSAIIGYRVYANRNSAGARLVKTIAAADLGSGYLYTGSVSGDTVAFYVTAYNAIDESAASATRTVTSQGPPASTGQTRLSISIGIGI